MVGRLRPPEQPEGDGMSEEIQKLDRRYKDWRGIVVHVVGFDRAGDRVIFMRAGYPHECAQPTEQFRRKFTRIL